MLAANHNALTTWYGTRPSQTDISTYACLFSLSGSGDHFHVWLPCVFRFTPETWRMASVTAAISAAKETAFVLIPLVHLKMAVDDCLRRTWSLCEALVDLVTFKTSVVNGDI
jgi:hypothetical protein